MAAELRHKQDRLTRLRNTPHLSRLTDRQLLFLAALEDFLQRWPDHEVVNDFEISHGFCRKAASLTGDEEMRFVIPVDGANVSMLVRRTKAADARESTAAGEPLFYCLCYLSETECVLGPCPCIC